MIKNSEKRSESTPEPEVHFVAESEEGVRIDKLLAERMPMHSRTYFQYLIEINKKGLGNNTNIFPSQIQEFPIIDIPLNYQQKIVDEIKSELDRQEELKQQIIRQRDEIDKLITASLTT